MVFSVPWLDGPVAFAAVMDHSAEMTLATTVSLAVVRGPVPLAKTLGAIDRLSGGRLLVARRPGLLARGLRRRRPRFLGTVAALHEAIEVAAGVWRPTAHRRRPFLFDRGICRWNPVQRDRAVPRSGSAAGGPRPGSAGWRALPTAGWRRPTTRRRSCSVSVASPALEARTITGRIPTRSRTRWRRCGATSPTTAPKPTV